MLKSEHVLQRYDTLINEKYASDESLYKKKSFGDVSTLGSTGGGVSATVVSVASGVGRDALAQLLAQASEWPVAQGGGAMTQPDLFLGMAAAEISQRRHVTKKQAQEQQSYNQVPVQFIQ